MLYIKSTREEWVGGGGVMAVLMPVGRGALFRDGELLTYKICIKINDAQTLNETKFDLCKCMMRRHI